MHGQAEYALVREPASRAGCELDVSDQPSAELRDDGDRAFALERSVIQRSGIGSVAQSTV